MNETLIGIIIGGVGTFLIEAFSGTRILRAERKQKLKETYAEFTCSINKGMRLVEDLERLTEDTKKLSFESKKVSKKPNLSSVEMIERKISRLGVQTNKIELEVDSFLAGMDAALSYFQLAAPKHVLSAGTAIRTGIDECVKGNVEFLELKQRYALFILVARFSLRNQILGWYTYKVSNRN
jgi:hypothetical protein